MIFKGKWSHKIFSNGKCGTHLHKFEVNLPNVEVHGSNFKLLSCHSEHWEGYFLDIFNLTGRTIKKHIKQFQIGYVPIWYTLFDKNLEI